MTDVVIVALIAAVPATIVGTGGLILGFMNRRKLGDVEQKVDGRLTELLELTRKSSHAEGVKEQTEKDSD
jgi:hypothetical protein